MPTPLPESQRAAKSWGRRGFGRRCTSRSKRSTNAPDGVVRSRYSPSCVTRKRASGAVSVALDATAAGSPERQRRSFARSVNGRIRNRADCGHAWLEGLGRQGPYPREEITQRRTQNRARAVEYAAPVPPRRRRHARDPIQAPRRTLSAGSEFGAQHTSASAEARNLVRAFAFADSSCRLDRRSLSAAGPDARHPRAERGRWRPEPPAKSAQPRWRVSRPACRGRSASLFRMRCGFLHLCVASNH